MQIQLDLFNIVPQNETDDFSAFIGIDDNLHTLFFQLYQHNTSIYEDIPILHYGTCAKEYVKIQPFEQMIVEQLKQYNLIYQFPSLLEKKQLFDASQLLLKGYYEDKQKDKTQNNFIYLAHLRKYIRRYKNRQNTKICMYKHYHSIKCDDIILSHSVSKSNNLDNQIIHLSYSAETNEYFTTHSKKDIYSTVCNSCHNHDEQVFSSIEKQNFVDPQKNYHVNLIFYRTLLQESYKVNSHLSYLSSVLKFNYAENEQFSISTQNSTLHIHAKNGILEEYPLNKQNYLLNYSKHILDNQIISFDIEEKRLNFVFNIVISPEIISNTIFIYEHIIFYVSFLRNKDNPFLLISFKNKEEFDFLFNSLIEDNINFDYIRTKIKLFFKFLLFFGNTGFNYTQTLNPVITDFFDMLGIYKNSLYCSILSEINILSCPLESYFIPAGIFKNQILSQSINTNVHLSENHFLDAKESANISRILDSSINDPETSEVINIMDKFFNRHAFNYQGQDFNKFIDDILQFYLESRMPLKENVGIFEYQSEDCSDDFEIIIFSFANIKYQIIISSFDKNEWFIYNQLKPDLFSAIDSPIPLDENFIYTIISLIQKEYQLYNNLRNNIVVELFIGLYLQNKNKI